MSREAKERFIQAGEKTIKLRCPICGSERFYRETVHIDVIFALLDKYPTYFACEDCSHMIWMEAPKEKYIESGKSQVDIWEEKFKRWGYAENRDTLIKVLDDDGYDEDAHKAAHNLLMKLNE